MYVESVPTAVHHDDHVEYGHDGHQQEWIYKYVDILTSTRGGHGVKGVDWGIRYFNQL